MSMLEIIQFENGRYGLRNVLTGIVIDRDWRTIFFANRARTKRSNNLMKTIRRLNRNKGKV